MISTVVSGSSGAANTNRSVRSRRASSPGGLRSAALKWFDMVAPSVVVAWVVVVLRPGISCTGSGAVPCRPGVGPGDGARAPSIAVNWTSWISRAGIWRPFVATGPGPRLHGEPAWARMVDTSDSLPVRNRAGQWRGQRFSASTHSERIPGAGTGHAGLGTMARFQRLCLPAVIFYLAGHRLSWTVNPSFLSTATAPLFP